MLFQAVRLHRCVSANGATALLLAPGDSIRQTEDTTTPAAQQGSAMPLMPPEEFDRELLLLANEIQQLEAARQSVLHNSPDAQSDLIELELSIRQLERFPF